MQGLFLSALAAGSVGFALAATKLGRGGDGGGGTLSANKSLVRKLYREVWNQADTAKAKAAATKFISEDHILIDPRRVPSLPPMLSFNSSPLPPPPPPSTSFTPPVDATVCGTATLWADLPSGVTLHTSERVLRRSRRLALSIRRRAAPRPPGRAHNPPRRSPLFHFIHCSFRSFCRTTRRRC